MPAFELSAFLSGLGHQLLIGWWLPLTAAVLTAWWLSWRAR